jgi:hypothetical protein
MNCKINRCNWVHIFFAARCRRKSFFEPFHVGRADNLIRQGGFPCLLNAEDTPQIAASQRIAILFLFSLAVLDFSSKVCTM